MRLQSHQKFGKDVYSENSLSQANASFYGNMQPQQPGLDRVQVMSPRSMSKKLTESRTVVNRQASILDENRIVLYKKGKRMGRGYYIVEISSGHTQLYITAFNVEKPQSLILEIPEKRARFILEQFEHDFEALAQCLRVHNDSKLILLNPHYSPQPSRQQLAMINKMRKNGFNTINFSSSDDRGVPLDNTTIEIEHYEEGEEDPSAEPTDGNI